MRVALRIDGCTTGEIRALTVALHRVGRTGELSVQAEGPEKWTCTTPPLQEREWRGVCSSMIEGLTT